MNIWELEEAQKALQEGEHALCARYMEKALERVRCYTCHEGLEDGRPYKPHFKGFVHHDCAKQYCGRGDYLNRTERP